MSEKLRLPILIKNPFHYLELWLLLIVLTAIILFFPVHLRYEYAPVESVLAIGNMIPLFAVLYYGWFAILVLLLFFSGERSDWHKLALVCLFTLGFTGLWIINTPNGGHADALMQLGNINYIVNEGTIIPNSSSLSYLEFPAFHILNAALLLVCGLGPFQTETLYMLFSFTLIAGLLFLLCKKCLGHSLLAALGVLLIMLGSVALRALSFWPGNLSLLLLVILLICLFTNTSTRSAPMTLVILILLAAFVMSYLPTPVYFIFILAGIYILQKVAGKKVLSLPVIALFLVLFFAWELSLAYIQFRSLTTWTNHFVEGLSSPQEALSAVAAPLTSSLGELMPDWAVVTRYVWLAVFAISGIFGMWTLVRVRKIASPAIVLTGSLVGASVFTVICAITFGAQSQWIRFQQIGPLFLIPILLMFFVTFKAHHTIKKYLFAGLIIMVLALSLPTFMLVGANINSNAVYAYEVAPLDYLSAHEKSYSEIYTDSSTRQMYFTYLSTTQFHTSPSPLTLTDKAELWERLFYLAVSFEKPTVKEKIYVLSERFLLPPQHPSAIQPDDTNFIEFIALIEKTDKCYDNGHTRLYYSLSTGVR